MTSDATIIDKKEKGVVQTYVANPYLIDGKKFDMRIYVLVTSVEPLRAYMCRDGLARFCTEQYEPPTKKSASSEDLCAHLTNYSVNKDKVNFMNSDTPLEDGVGSKWSIEALSKRIIEDGHDWEQIWGRVQDVMVKTLLAALPKMVHKYKILFPRDTDGGRCFTVFGGDVLLDEDLNPHIMEVNAFPSMNFDTPVDIKVKEALIRETLRIVNPLGYTIKSQLEDEAQSCQDGTSAHSRTTSFKRRSYKEMKENDKKLRDLNTRARLDYEDSIVNETSVFDRIFPCPRDEHRFDHLL